MTFECCGGDLIRIECIECLLGRYDELIHKIPQGIKARLIQSGVRKIAIFKSKDDMAAKFVVLAFAAMVILVLLQVSVEAKKNKQQFISTRYPWEKTQ